MGRIASTFQALRAQQRTGLVVYLTVGFPSLHETPVLVQAALEGGASIIELGVPFSDPLADGATIQRANQVALEQGVTMADCLAVVRALRSQGVAAPLLLMGYYNTWLSYGLERWCTDAAAAGVDGAIIVDLPPEEAGPALQAARAHDLDLVFLVAPTSSDERLAAVGRVARGFVYCVSLTGVTGARSELPAGLPDFVARVRRHTALPLAVGFGVSRREHVQAIGQLAEAAVVGSALTQVIEQAPPGQRAAAVRGFVSGLVGVPAAP